MKNDEIDDGKGTNVQHAVYWYRVWTSACEEVDENPDDDDDVDEEAMLRLVIALIPSRNGKG